MTKGAAVLRKGRTETDRTGGFPREGFEVKGTEALMKGKPVVAYRTGGISLQIEDGLDGFLVDVGDPLHVARHLSGLLTDAELYQRMIRAAVCLCNTQDYLTVSNAICWLFLVPWLLEKGHIEDIIALSKRWPLKGDVKQCSNAFSSL